MKIALNAMISIFVKFFEGFFNSEKSKKASNTTQAKQPKTRKT